LTIAQIVERLKGSGLHAQLERQARLSLHNPEIKLQSLKEDIKEYLKTSGWEKKLHNAVYREISMFPLPYSPSVPPEHIKEPLAYMRKAQANWEKRILKSLNSMCIELGIPLSQKRPLSEQKELLNKWNEMGTDEPDLSLFRPVYAPKDFLEVLMNLRNPNYDTSEVPNFRNHLGLIQVPLNVKDIPELVSIHQLYENEHVRLGQKVLMEQDSAAAQQYVRQGSPNSLRAELWALILNISTRPEVSQKSRLEGQGSACYSSDILNSPRFIQPKISIVKQDSYEDVKLTASNDDYYFVFEDYLYQVLLCFSRDTSVLEHFEYNSATPPRSFIRGKDRFI
ncbi:PREDICTED: TBC1 domain family member 19, partial [Thamnophis sirtalis]|uniref:TBC1 domain family member 19 n=1 Tax=Thamnophis sirtalis TaxID=35019 RepID=A0A6I9YBI4_9SAUR